MGQRLVRVVSEGTRLAGLVIEAEAYVGQEDQGCHARVGRTQRNAVMWGPPGHAYVYFTYGMHWMLNLVTEAEGVPAAILLRGILPSEGLAQMRRRRSVRRRTRSASPLADLELVDGPAKLCQALGLDGRWNGYDLCNPKSRLFVERRPALKQVRTGPRIGLDNVSEPWKSIPWRFQVPSELRPQLLAAEGIQ